MHNTNLKSKYRGFLFDTKCRTVNKSTTKKGSIETKVINEIE